MKSDRTEALARGIAHILVGDRWDTMVEHHREPYRHAARFALDAFAKTEPDSDPDLGKIGPGHVCKHGIRWPHACEPCDEAAYAAHQAQKSDLERARGENNLTQQADRIENWMRRTMRFVDLCDADAAGYDDLHDEAGHLLRVGFSIFGFDPDGRFASIDNVNINPLPLRDDLDAMLAFAKSECATRDAEIERLRSALVQAEIFADASSMPSRLDPDHSAEIRELGQRIGYGALMHGASALWRVYLEERGLAGGEFVVGTCQTTANNAHRNIRAALSNKDAG